MDEFAWFMRAFFDLSGIDLAKYKRPQMERRLTNLRDRRGFSSFREYIEALTTEPSLMAELLDKMTINVSEFFRNKERWLELQSYLRTLPGPIQAWSAACATGEEPYTLAMILNDMQIPFHPILATDIDERVLERAKAGRYDQTVLREMEDARRLTYFQKEQATYVVHPSLRKQIDFRQHNLLVDSYPKNLDLIICRNVLIYFTDETKEEILRKFSNALVPGGILFVGSTEQFLGLKLEKLHPVAPFLYQKTP